mgnify:CR=1 FL=1
MATKTIDEIIALVIAKVKEITAINNRIYHINPPVTAAYPCISYYLIAAVPRKTDDETIYTEVVLSFDLFGTSPVYSLMNSLDTKLKELTVKVEVEGVRELDDPLHPEIHRLNVQYRFIWNY